MSYLSFMPWTLQKRLLRYLLSQLDFLETDDLDLEDLGITWGQRSVVELRNLGLKAKVRTLFSATTSLLKTSTNNTFKKLCSMLSLPKYIDIFSARITHLKLTVPADILTSGIVVEVTGVEIRVRIEPEDEREHSFSRREQRTAPAKGTKSNRPRISTPTVHDPGGRRAGRKGLLEDPLFHPDLAAHHLAESFLQTESQQDRLELQAAIASRSQYGRESVASSASSEEELGIGAAEGSALPSFIASYLVGIADRLQIRVKDLAAHIEFRPHGEKSSFRQTESLSSTRVLIKLSELHIDHIDALEHDGDGRRGKRKVVLHQFGVLVLPEVASGPSGPGSSQPSSPILRNFQSSTAPSQSLSSAAPERHSGPKPQNLNKWKGFALTSIAGSSEIEQSIDLEGSGLKDRPSDQSAKSAAMKDSVSALSVRSGFAEDRGQESPSPMRAPPPHGSEDDVFDDPSDIENDPGSFFLHRSTGSRRTSNTADVDNRMHAETLATSGQLTSNQKDGMIDRRGVEDLTESRIFTHDEAESMYMSAVSASRGSPQRLNAMPGGWDSSGEHRTMSPGRIQPAPDERFEAHDSERCSPTVSTSRSTASSPLIGSSLEKDGPADVPDMEHDESQLVQHVLIIDRVTAWIPTGGQESPVTATSDEAPGPETSLRTAGSQSPPSTGRTKSGDQSSPEKSNTKYSESAFGAAIPESSNSIAEETNTTLAIEVEVLNVHCQFDMALGKIFVAIANSLIKQSTGTTENRTTTVDSSTTGNVSLRVSNVKVLFLEHVAELPISSAATTQSLSHKSLLLSASVAGLVYIASHDNGGMQQRIHIARIALSHSRSDFLYFSHDSRMRSSLKDTILLQNNDVEVFISFNSMTTKVEIQTKPVRLVLELGQLDDILSRSGGLSSLLDLGSSIASSGTIRTSPGKTSTRQNYQRGVRFEDMQAGQKSSDDFTLGPGKVNVRIGGMKVDLVGSDCTLCASTSAIKLVHRAEGVGMQIDRLLLQGPFFSSGKVDPALTVNLHNIRVEYLSTPNDKDLDRLLALLTPSKDKYDADDDIMLDTLLRQRRQGGVLRLTVSSWITSFEGIFNVAHLTKIGNELGKLSTVAKYLPEDDRPGILSLGLVKNLEVEVDTGTSIGKLQLKMQDLEGAHVNLPALMAAQVRTASVHRDEVESLFGEAVTYSDPSLSPPMIMCRFVADEMDPTVKLKIFNICVEYHVPFILALLSMATTPGDTTSETQSEKSQQSVLLSSSPSSSDSAAEFVRRTNISIDIRDSSLAFNPRDGRGRALFILTDTRISSPLEHGKDIRISTEVRKASLMVINQVQADDISPHSVSARSSPQSEEQIKLLLDKDYVPVGFISSAVIAVSISQMEDAEEKSADIELKNALFILESCADSTQTLISILNGLSPPATQPKISPYRTEIVPIEDLLASFTGDAFITEPGPDAGLRAQKNAGSAMEVQDQQDLEYVSEFYQPDLDDKDDISESGIHSEMLDSEIAESTVSITVAPVTMKQSLAGSLHHEGPTNSLLDFREDHFGRNSAVGGTAHRWDSTQNTYGLASERHIKHSPLKVRVRNVHVIWNLFDGYDWQSTRDVISEAVKDIETRAAARRPRSSNRLSPGAEDEDESVIGDFLFNSIYIGIPANRDPRELANEINRDIDDLTSDTGSYATTTTITTAPSRHQPSRPRQKKLKLTRSKQHKMTFELKGISADMLVFPPGSGEVQSSIDVRVKDLEIFDHIPTSTWKKFATYMRDAGEREADTSMVHIELLNVKPVADLTASEMILKLTVLPLRLHVDQDALDFMSRFFEFKDESAPLSITPSTPPFLQRVEVNPVKVKLDFKPKRVDYGGLRSGRTTEFMNFFVLDQADMILRRVILYGVSGFDRLGIMLNNIWMPDIKRNQLPGILAGLAPIRSLVNVGSGVRDLVVVPMREYKKDGRIVRSIQKGALAFAKTTTKELVGLGAKLAIGTQTVLQNAETLLAPTSPDEQQHVWEDVDPDDPSRRQISLYADQPIGVVQGLRGAYASLERDLLLAKDAIIAVPGEAMASGSATGAAKAILRQAPTIILRPAIGASKAVGKTLLGAGNTLDRENYRRVEEVRTFPLCCNMMDFLVRTRMLTSFVEVQKVLDHPGIEAWA
jgi:autophagy-related protein 2